MNGSAIAIFVVSLIMFVTSIVLVMYNASRLPAPVDVTSSGIPNPNSSWIGAKCPVGCTCFPNSGATLPTDKPTQMCGYLSNNTMFNCPAECCQPTCINQDVQNFMVRS